jgi:hypothetical protein
LGLRGRFLYTGVLEPSVSPRLLNRRARGFPHLMGLVTTAGKRVISLAKWPQVGIEIDFFMKAAA